LVRIFRLFDNSQHSNKMYLYITCTSEQVNCLCLRFNWSNWTIKSANVPENGTHWSMHNYKLLTYALFQHTSFAISRHNVYMKV
jgi:hypothetical protein